MIIQPSLLLTLLLHVSITTSNAFSTGIFPGFLDPNIVEFEPEIEEKEMEIKGKTNAKIVIEKIVAYPARGQEDEVVLRNVGGQTADLSGWRMTDSQPQESLVFGIPGCEGNSTIPPQQFLKILPFSDSNPCGFPFGISFRDSLILYNERNEVMANVTWEAAEQGTALQRLADNEYALLPVSDSATIMDVLQATGKYKHFVRALHATGLADKLRNAVKPGFDGVILPSPPPSPSYNVEFPWWFGFTVDRTMLPPPPPPPPPPPSPPVGVVPDFGPYTVLAPSDEAFNQFRLYIGGNKAMIPMDLLLALPELSDLLQYHIIHGAYTTNYMFNNSGIKTTLGPEVVVLKDPSMTEGHIALSDNCIDKPTVGFPCEVQKEFDKCFEPFMLSPLAAGWQGGFCQKTCGRCTCKQEEGGICAQIGTPDLLAANGVIQGVSRVLFPPPIFEELDAIVPEPEDEIEALTIQNTQPQYELPRLPRLPRLPTPRTPNTRSDLNVSTLDLVEVIDVRNASYAQNTPITNMENTQADLLPSNLPTLPSQTPEVQEIQDTVIPYTYNMQQNMVYDTNVGIAQVPQVPRSFLPLQSMPTPTSGYETNLSPNRFVSLPEPYNRPGFSTSAASGNELKSNLSSLPNLSFYQYP